MSAEYSSKWVKFKGTELEALCVDYIYNVAMSSSLGGMSYLNEQERLRIHDEIDDLLPRSRERTQIILNNLEKELGISEFPKTPDEFRHFKERKVILYGKKLAKALSSGEEK